MRTFRHVAKHQMAGKAKVTVKASNVGGPRLEENDNLRWFRTMFPFGAELAERSVVWQ